MSLTLIEVHQKIDDMLWNWPKFKPCYKPSKKYRGMMVLVKSPACKRYIAKIEKLRKIRDQLLEALK